jgi:hypothetical protein
MIVIYDVVEQERLLMLKMLGFFLLMTGLQRRSTTISIRLPLLCGIQLSLFPISVQEFSVTDMHGVPKIV